MKKAIGTATRDCTRSFKLIPRLSRRKYEMCPLSCAADLLRNNTSVSTNALHKCACVLRIWLMRWGQCIAAYNSISKTIVMIFAAIFYTHDTFVTILIILFNCVVTRIMDDNTSCFRNIPIVTGCVVGWEPKSREIWRSQGARFYRVQKRDIITFANETWCILSSAFFQNSIAP